MEIEWDGEGVLGGIGMGLGMVFERSILGGVRLVMREFERVRMGWDEGGMNFGWVV